VPVEPFPLVAPAADQENSTPASQCPVRPWCRCDGAVGAVEAVEGRFGRFAWGRGVVGRCWRVELLAARNVVGSGGLYYDSLLLDHGLAWRCTVSTGVLHSLAGVGVVRGDCTC